MYFTPKTFDFLRALASNNNRAWFNDHKDDYEQHARAPALRLIADIAEPLAQISPELRAIAKKVGGSLFRIHRDVRYSHDKSPYKTHIGIQFVHAATKAAPRSSGSGNADLGRLDAPGLYLHIEPGASFVGGGIWHPQPATLKRIRDDLVSNPVSWQQATRAPAFTEFFTLGGDALKRPPRGYDPDHPLIDDLRRKDFIASCALTDAEVLRTDLVALLIARYQRMAPMIDWLCGALDLEF
ncbi:DUF2461 domain-containing protein [Sinimarinibacterium sp. NLF-5-8]|uniref:DUF2461 domain-containing protein n=1 Tax=Sinimarinibacterium sp. NLF-5-8 TaxID=2698684 RepID=UPI00192F0F7D|nr:DUF2461 domain-containing protein [Sinimarinibacterium sp. NLF-5-8]